MKKGIIHFHSTVSFDGLNSISSILKAIVKNNLKYILLTDHDTIRGSLLLRNKVKKLKLDVEVPLCAEYKTSHGDLIAAYIQREIKNMELNNFIDEVRSQNGIILFPHPYVGHKNIEEIISKVDAVEIFNGRSNENDDINAYKLAKKHNKPVYWASDSHINSTLLNVIVGYDKKNITFKEALLSNYCFPLKLNRSGHADMFMSQIKKSFVERNIKLFLSTIIRLIYIIIKR